MKSLIPVVMLLTTIVMTTSPTWPDQSDVLPTYVALKTATAYPPPAPIDGIVTLALQSGASVKLRAIDVDYDRTAAYLHDVVIKAQTATPMTDKATGRPYLNMTFSRTFFATAWVVDVDYEVMRSGFSAYDDKLKASGVIVASKISGEVGAKCAKDWPDDFRMRRYCEDQQQSAIAALNGRSMRTGDEKIIRAKCERDWPDDYRMRNYCEEQQLKAIR